MSVASVCRRAVEFYTIEVSHLVDGTMFVTITATSVDEKEPQLLTQEISSERVSSVDAVLALIGRGLGSN